MADHSSPVMVSRPIEKAGAFAPGVFLFYPARDPQICREASAPCYAASLMRRLVFFVLLLLFPMLSLAQAKTDALDQLASDFWTWRAKYRPFSGDDIPRLERPGGTRDWSASAMAKQREDLGGFEHRWTAMDTANWPVARLVDYRLMGSAIARVRWELDVNPRWQRDPSFYIEQTVVALQEELLPPSPFDQTRSQEIVTRVENIPSILEQGRANLKPVAPFAQLALASISDLESRFAKVEQ